MPVILMPGTNDQLIICIYTIQDSCEPVFTVCVLARPFISIFHFSNSLFLESLIKFVIFLILMYFPGTRTKEKAKIV